MRTAEHEAILRHAGFFDGVPGTSFINAYYKWVYGGFVRTREEELFFGKTPRPLTELLYSDSPLLSMLKGGS